MDIRRDSLPIPLLPFSLYFPVNHWAFPKLQTFTKASVWDRCHSIGLLPNSEQEYDKQGLKRGFITSLASMATWQAAPTICHFYFTWPQMKKGGKMQTTRTLGLVYIAFPTADNTNYEWQWHSPIHTPLGTRDQSRQPTQYLLHTPMPFILWSRNQIWAIGAGATFTMSALQP